MPCADCNNTEESSYTPRVQKLVMAGLLAFVLVMTSLKAGALDYITQLVQQGPQIAVLQDKVAAIEKQVDRNTQAISEMNREMGRVEGISIGFGLFLTILQAVALIKQPKTTKR